MNKKKLLALLMALVMTLTLVPVTAFAEEVDAGSAVASVTVGETVTYYGSLKDAIDTAESGDTVTLLTDTTASGIWIKKNLTIDGGGNTVTSTTNFPVFLIGDNSTVSIRDLNISHDVPKNSTQAYSVYILSADKVTVDNCNITSDYYAVGIVTASGANVSITDSTLSGWSALYLLGATDCTVNVSGSTLTGNNQWATTPQSDFATVMVQANGSVSSGNIVNLEDCIINADTIANKQVPFCILNGSNNSISMTGDSMEAHWLPEDDIFEDYGTDSSFSISGGTYDHELESTWIAPGYMAVERTESETWEVVPAVAQIGSTNYETLAAAAAAVADGQTIVMLNDVTEEDEVVFDHNNAAFTLDLAGHTVTVNNDIWAKNGHLTLTSSVAGGKVADGQNGAAIYVSSNYNNAQGTLTIDSDNVTVEGGQWGIAFMSNSVVNINAGTVKAVSTVEDKDSYGISGNGNSTGAQVNISGGNVTGNTLGVYFPGSNALNISGGTISGEVGVYVKSGTTTITGGTINGTGDKRDYSYYGNGGRSTGDAVVIDNCNYPSGAPSASIKGATITSANGKQIGYYVYESSDEGTVVADKAYSLSTNVPAKGWVANSGENADNYPKTIGTPTAVAKVGDVEYGTLAAAIAAANENGGTVTLLRNYDMEANEPGYGYTTAYYAYGEDTTRDNMIEIKDGVILDLNSCTLSNLYNNTFNVTGDNVTFQNGTMLLGQLYYDKSKGTYSYGSYIVYVTGAQNFTVRNMTASGINVANGSTATMEGLTFRGYGFYAVCAQVNSTVTLSGGTYDKAEAGKANYLFWIEDGSTMNITGGNYITGTSAFKTSSSVNPVITGGTFDFDPTNKGVADGYEAVALTGANTGKWQVGKVKATELTLDTTAQNDNTTATYTATKSVVDESGELIPGTTEEATITVTVSTIAEQAAPTTTEKAYEPAQLSNIKVDEVVAVAVDKADDEGNTKAEVVVQLAKDAGNVDTENKKVTYEVHPEAIITVKNDQNETVGAPTTVALTNDQIQGTFSFKLFVPTDVAAAGDTVTVTHIHEDGTEENLGVFTVEDGNVITIRNIKEFSYFGVSATAPVQTDSGAHFAYLGASLRRRVKANDHNIVVNTSTDIRFTYEIKNYDPNLNYYFQWKKGADGEWSNAVAITDFSGSNASLVINNVPSGAFDMELFTRIYVQEGDNVYMLSNEGNGINRSVEQVATALKNSNITKWSNYAKFLLNEGVSSYLITDYN